MTETTIHTEAYNVSRPILAAVITGTIVTLGLMVAFSLLGLAIGIASIEAVGDGLGLGAAIYIVLTQIISLAVGGFAAARFISSMEKSLAVLAGTAVWALTTLTMALIGGTAGTMVISSSTALIAQTAKTTSGAVQAIAPDNVSLPDLSEIAGSVSMADLPPELQQTLQDADVTPEQMRTEAREAFRNVISEQEMNQAQSLFTATLSNIASRPATFSDEVDRLLDQLFEGENAVINEEDLAEAESALQTRLGLTDREAQQMVESVQNSFDSAVETLRQSMLDLQDRFMTAAEDVQSTASAAALWLLVASLLGLGAAAGAGLYGRR